MVCVRQATVEDLLQMQKTNLMCLPENYQLKVQDKRSRDHMAIFLVSHFPEVAQVIFV